jgi:DNA-directed RNA polymerase subunit beta'
MGRVDELRGFKENVILGHLIPGGTGFPLHRYLKLVPTCEPVSEEVMEELREEQRKRNEALYGKRPTGPEEDEDGEGEIIGPVTTIYDEGDNSADGEDFLTADELVTTDSDSDDTLI